MGRHEGRRANPAPGPGAGGRPAAGPAATPTEPAASDAPVYEPTPTAEAVLALVNDLCGLYAEARAARATVAYLAGEAEQAHVLARAAHWDTLVSDRYHALAEAIHTTLPATAQVERFMPVRPLGNGHVELHAHDATARPVVVLLTGAQALAVGAHLTAYAAISLDRIGQRPDPGLPHVKPAPPFTTTATPADPTGPAGPPADHPDPPAAQP